MRSHGMGDHGRLAPQRARLLTVPQGMGSSAEVGARCTGRTYPMTRKRPLVHLSLSPDAIARLAEIATRCGETRSGVVEKLIREAEMPRPRTAGATRT
jgi:hypothetical protein